MTTTHSCTKPTCFYCSEMLRLKTLYKEPVMMLSTYKVSVRVMERSTGFVFLSLKAACIYAGIPHGSKHRDVFKNRFARF